MIENSYKMSNFFLESIISNNKDKIYINDISRIAYINNSGEEDNIILKQQLDKEENKIINPIINYKETFKERNDRINSLNEEILKLKQKLKIIEEKDQQINELDIKNKELIQNIEKSNKEINELKIKNKELIQELEKLNQQINEMIQLKNENNKLKEDKNLIQNQIKELKQNNNKKEKDNKIKINIVQLKEILINRLKTYHENHINELINKYDLNHKKEIDKSLMENILLKAIHL